MPGKSEFGLLVLLGLVALLGVPVLFSRSPRVGVVVVCALAAVVGMVLVVLSSVAVPGETRILVVLFFGLFVPVGAVLLHYQFRRRKQPRPRRADAIRPRIGGMVKDFKVALAAQLRQAAGTHHCPDCGADLPANAPEGLCPRCLLGSGLASPSPTPPPASPRGTTPYPGPFTAPEPAELAPHFPQLEIVELIGQGGMGAVYKARQTKLDRTVALKILPPEWGTDPAFAERFAREARTLARLNHPHIVAVHDFGESGGLYYLVMEFVDGPNLREALRTGPLPPEQALAVIPQVCDALQYAHEEGVVHRDVKPENILLDRRGRVKIADFGLAKLLNRPRAEFTLTGSRQVMGTADYMAPEQRTRPLEIDHRADIYSLGVVLYEMLTGELPLGRFAPPSATAGVDPRLDEVVHRALETDPDRRYQSISDIKADVASLAGGAAPAVQPVGPVKGVWPASDLDVALRQVRGPATGLMLAGILAPLGWLLVILVWAVLSVPWWSSHPLWQHDPLRVVIEMGRRDLEPFSALLFLNLVFGGIVIAGARKMRKCEAYELAFIASYLALFPLGPGFALGLPMGIWSLVILNRRRVKAGFALNLGEQPATPPGGGTGARPKPPTGPVRRKVRSFVNSVLAMFVSRPGKGYSEEERLSEHS
jgi:tRNA A-37 threonylcarbamoyl transferase component Bud32